jgi:hypothetical protein
MTTPKIRYWRGGLEFAIGLSGVLVGVNFIYDPSALRASALGQMFHSLPNGWEDYALWTWVVSYTLGGLLILCALWKGNAVWEVMGLGVVASLIAIYTVALWYVFGRQGLIAIANSCVVLVGICLRMSWLWVANKVRLGQMPIAG